jgi:hypothetical protein
VKHFCHASGQNGIQLKDVDSSVSHWNYIRVRYDCQEVNRFGSAPVRARAWEELNFRPHPCQTCAVFVTFYIGLFFENVSRMVKFR